MPKVPSALTELRTSLPQSQSSTSSTSSSHIPTPFDMLQERDLVVTKVNKTAERHIERLDIKFESLGMAKAVVIAALWHAAVSPQHHSFHLAHLLTKHLGQNCHPRN